jgi:ParB-like nuclease domain
MARSKVSANGHQPERDLVRVCPLEAIIPAPENDDIYNRIALDDPEMIELARSIKTHGVQQPLLVSQDGYIISGHRRRIAAKIAGLMMVPVRTHTVSRTQDPEAFLKLLVEMNSQRIKSVSVQLHETLIKIDPKKAHQQIVNDRKEKDAQRSLNNLTTIDPKDNGRRCKIKAKRAFLDAVLRILEEQREYWPLSDRQIHYRLLNDPPLTHDSGSIFIHRMYPPDCKNERIETT